jgi:hypothetical protein
MFLEGRYLFQDDLICASRQGFNGGPDPLVVDGRDADDRHATSCHGRHAVSRHVGGYQGIVTSEDGNSCEAGRSRGTVQLVRVRFLTCERLSAGQHILGRDPLAIWITLRVFSPHSQWQYTSALNHRHRYDETSRSYGRDILPGRFYDQQQNEPRSGDQPSYDTIQSSVPDSAPNRRSYLRQHATQNSSRETVHGNRGGSIALDEVPGLIS